MSFIANTLGRERKMISRLLLTLLMPDMWVFHAKQFWHQLPPWLRAQCPLTAPHLRRQVRVWASDQLAINWGSYDPLGLNNLLEQLTEFRRGLYLLLLFFLYKGYNSRTAKWKRCMGQGGWERMQSFHALSGCFILPAPHCVYQRGSSLNLLFRVFIEVPLHRCDWLLTIAD